MFIKTKLSSLLFQLVNYDTKSFVTLGGATTFSITTLSIMPLRIMTFSITTLSMKGFFATLSITAQVSLC
jgi:hypothetical protein